MRLQFLLLFLGFCGPVLANETVGDIPVPTSPGLTAHDLLAQVFPGLERTEDGLVAAEPVTLRLLLEPEFVGLPHENTAIRAISFQALESDGKNYLLLLASLGPSETAVGDVALLALYDDAFELLDTADVGSDRFTAFAEQPLIEIGADTQAAFVVNHHGNSNQGYFSTALVGVLHDRLAVFAEAFAFSDRGCGWINTQNVEFSTRPGGADPWPLIALLSDTHQPDSDCEPTEDAGEESTRTLELNFEWSASAGRYELDPDDGPALELWTEQTRARF
jgi:hypothetical protein